MSSNKVIQLPKNNRLPKILIINGVDRVGKDSFIEEVDKQTKYRHITIDRGPDGFQAYCDIFGKEQGLKEMYKFMEKSFAKNPFVLNIYITCSTDELINRCIETDHEILDFDTHKQYMEYYFDNSEFKRKIKVDTTNTHVSDIVSELIEAGVL
ncbi:hypothetical protein [Staphylococcus equorum]|uniref:Uncharacterized protein n=1 Tax=Staphylococcus equorum TaxID=246432 RepID=A0A9X4R2Q5_9STAP|nr:hypothetical protein [Staphylococcus equorum]MDG0860366.1 hypothetical protein [Staphylococcus equorum]